MNALPGHDDEDEEEQRRDIGSVYLDETPSGDQLDANEHGRLNANHGDGIDHWQHADLAQPRLLSPKDGLQQSSSTPSLSPLRAPVSNRLVASLDSPLSPAGSWKHSASQTSSLSELVNPSNQSEPYTSNEIARWTNLNQITKQLVSGSNSDYGAPTCISGTGLIATGTSEGFILIFDYRQRLRQVFRSIDDTGSVSALTVSADHTLLCAGYTNGTIHIWDLEGGNLFQSIPFRSGVSQGKFDGHLENATICHIDFVSARRSLIVSADNQGFCYLHTVMRGLRGRSVRSVRLLGRTGSAVSRNPVLAVSSLRLGTASHFTEEFGLVAIATMKRLLVISTLPTPATQYMTEGSDSSTPTATSGSVAWLPVMRATSGRQRPSEPILAYCRSECLQIFRLTKSADHQVGEVEALTCSLVFSWSAPEPIVTLDWLNQNYLILLTKSQVMSLFDIDERRATKNGIASQMNILHHDHYSRSSGAAHGPFCGQYDQTFRIYKGRMFVLGSGVVFVGTFLSWADQILSLINGGQFARAIRLSIDYHNGTSVEPALGLPSEEMERKRTARGKMREVVLSLLNFLSTDKGKAHLSDIFMIDFCKACIDACLVLQDNNLLFSEVYEQVEDLGFNHAFLLALEPFIIDGALRNVPTSLINEYINIWVVSEEFVRLQTVLCHVLPQNLDVSKIYWLANEFNLFDVLVYCQTQTLQDFVEPFAEFMNLLRQSRSMSSIEQGGHVSINLMKVFPYLSYTLTSRTYPTEEFTNDSFPKSETYRILFSEQYIERSTGELVRTDSQDLGESYPYLKALLRLDTQTFLDAIDEGFEDSFLNHDIEGTRSDEDFHISRQHIIRIFFDIFAVEFPEKQIFLYMFCARNLPKYPQFVVLSGTVYERIIEGLCSNRSEVLREDCQLSLEYVLSLYKPTDSELLLKRCKEAGFIRILHSLLWAERRFSELLLTYIEHDLGIAQTLGCMQELLIPSSLLSPRQRENVKSVVLENVRYFETDLARFARALENVANEMHSLVVPKLTSDNAKYDYLCALSYRDGPDAPDMSDSRTPLNVDWANRELVMELIRLTKMKSTEKLPVLVRSLPAGSFYVPGALEMFDEGEVDANLVETKLYLYMIEENWSKASEQAKQLCDLSLFSQSVEDTTRAQEKGRLVIGMYEEISKRSCDKDLSETIWTDLLVALTRYSAGKEDEANREMRELCVTLVQTVFTVLLTINSETKISHWRNEQRDRQKVDIVKIFRDYLKVLASEAPSMATMHTTLDRMMHAYYWESQIRGLVVEIQRLDSISHIDEFKQRRNSGWCARAPPRTASTVSASNALCWHCLEPIPRLQSPVPATKGIQGAVVRARMEEESNWRIRFDRIQQARNNRRLSRQNAIANLYGSNPESSTINEPPGQDPPIEDCLVVCATGALYHGSCWVLNGQHKTNGTDG